MAGLQKYSSQEYLHCGAEMDSLKVRNNPIMLPGPQEPREGESQAYLSRDGSLYQSNEHLTISEAKRRSRHRSGSQSRDTFYTWAGCAQLVGTGLLVGKYMYWLRTSNFSRSSSQYFILIFVILVKNPFV